MGIPRPGKDVDWTKEVKTLTLTATTLPPPSQLSVSELLANKLSGKKPVAQLIPLENTVEGMSRTNLYFT